MVIFYGSLKLILENKEWIFHVYVTKFLISDSINKFYFLKSLLQKYSCIKNYV